MNISEEPLVPPRLFLKRDQRSSPITVNVPKPHHDEAFGRIRCPHCKDWYEETEGRP